MLRGCVDIKTITVVTPALHIVQTATVYVVTGLFGYVGHERLKVELVAASPELVCIMIFQSQTLCVGKSIKSVKAQAVRHKLAQLRKTVAVAVVRIAVAVAFIESQTVVAGGSDDRSVGTYIFFPCTAIQIRNSSRGIESVVQRVLGDHIDRTSHRIGAEKSRSASTHHFDTIDHAYRHLLKGIYTGKGTHDRTAIDKNLRIRPFKAIDTHLWETTVLAVALHP